ncbi:MAG TPA: DEAD/DEAH box helicase [Chloroflexi bacterium]|nr:DEAD/DEAH box helicase [Chloroflexota bacterium]
MTDILVTNAGPATTTQTHRPSLELFRRYCEETYDERFDPFEHQAKIFDLVGAKDESVMLVAGTAAGKTLALGVPLFHKLATGRIKRVLLMYPTIALMNDQRRVMDRLAELTNQDVGHIQGGMKRSALIAALNKPVIVATPDAIYWFFRKSVKYSSLLIYGLALIDEFVLDEAHLFNGLTMRNVQHLKSRIMALAETIGPSPRWHILTATPTQALRDLVPRAEPVTGKSKCGDVQVKFLPPVEPKERGDVLSQAVDDALASEARKVLLVLNSAAAAHRLFEDIRGEQPVLPVDLQRRFGRVPWGTLQRWMSDESIVAETISNIAAWINQSDSYTLADLSAGDRVGVATDVLMEKSTRFLHKIARQIKDAAYAAGREASGSGFLRQVRKCLTGQDARALWREVQDELSPGADPNVVKEALNVYLTKIGDALAQVWRDETLTVAAPDFAVLTASLKATGLPVMIADGLSRYLCYSVELDEEQTRQVRKSPTALNRRPVALRWLEEKWLIEDAAQRQALARRLEAALEDGTLEVETRHIAVWGESGVPAVIYTGQMSRRDREGLIEAFEEMERAVLVSTPAVEVGVDFKADLLITEECDGNGFLQRFGRVGRTGEGRAEVRALVREGETWARLQRRHQAQMSREGFSQMIIDPDAPTDPDRSLFPDRIYAAASIYQDATHCLINRQVGRVGQRLNAVMFADPEVGALAHQMEEADVPFAYGLRGTLPRVSLLGGGSGSPFYVLSKVPNEGLVPSPSPFEMAQAQIGYTRFLYTKRRWDISVDWPRTLAASRAMFYWLDGRWQIATGYGVAKTFMHGGEVVDHFQGNVTAMRQQLAEVRNPHVQEILRLGEALNLYNAPQARYILGQGDVFLKRVEREGRVKTAVQDRLGSPLLLSDQLWLYLGGDTNEAWKRLQAEGVDDLSEVHYPDREEEALVLLDEVAGGCFHVYERLVQDAN